MRVALYGLPGLAKHAIHVASEIADGGIDLAESDSHWQSFILRDDLENDATMVVT
jgi:hypothetical protein